MEKSAQQNPHPPSQRAAAPAFCVGVDIANTTFVARIFNGLDDRRNKAPQTFSQDPNGFADFVLWLDKAGVTTHNSVIGMETTGVLTRGLCTYLYLRQYSVRVIDAATIARHRSPSRPKSDPADSDAIVEYLHRYYDRLQPWKPRETVFEHIQQLLSQRELLVRQRTALKNHNKSHQRAGLNLNQDQMPIELVSTMNLDMIAMFSANIKIVEQALVELLKAHPDLDEMRRLLSSIPGIQMLASSDFIAVVVGMDRALDPKAIASHLGVCPHERSSGTSLRRKPRSTQLGPRRLRKLMHLAARSAATHNPHFKEYYQRKLREGKPKMVALNNVTNKLLKIMCAVIRERREYSTNYRSMAPSGS